MGVENTDATSPTNSVVDTYNNDKNAIYISKIYKAVDELLKEPPSIEEMMEVYGINKVDMLGNITNKKNKLEIYQFVSSGKIIYSLLTKESALKVISLREATHPIYEEIEYILAMVYEMRCPLTSELRLILKSLASRIDDVLGLDVNTSVFFQNKLKH